jgi:hypothetical protein
MTPELECVLATCRVSLGGLPADSPLDLPDMAREDLARLFGTLQYQRGVEVGVESGRFAKMLLENNAGLKKLYLVDAWRKYEGYREHVTQTQADGHLNACMARLQQYQHRAQYVRKFSLEAATKFKDASLDFVYVDANHSLPHVLDDICAWAPKVRRGGIVAGHDFRRNRNTGRNQCHVVEAVIAYTTAYQINPWFVLGRKDPDAGERRDHNRSFFWVVE